MDMKNVINFNKKKSSMVTPIDIMIQETNISLCNTPQNPLNDEANKINKNNINKELHRLQLSNHSILREEPIIAYITFLAMIGIELYWYIRWIYKVDGTDFWARLFVFPILFMLSSFYVNIMVNCVFNIFIPARWIKQNTKYYSHNKPDLNTEYNGYDIESISHSRPSLPSITVQIPVYKESFQLVIKLTIDNILAIAKEYQEKGGKINIFINDDGLMLLDEIERAERIDYYKSHDEIFYIGRPKENRAGRFKKASNMNFGLRKIVDAHNLCEIQNTFSCPIVALKYLAETQGFLCGGNDRDLEIGDYILLLDSDSRVPHDTLPYIIHELEMYKDLGFVQMLTTPMQVTHDYWENAISHFTDHIYRISFVYSSATGNSAPLVGHNAILRWKAIHDASYIVKNTYNDDYQIMYWSEDKVSEDFDMSLRMQSIGYTSRYIGYANGFEEGVSLTVCEEINRLKKYAYGVNEILFFPVYECFANGILSIQIKKFMFCKTIPIHTKFSIIIYMASYYALATTPILTIVQYFCYRYSTYWQINVLNNLSIIYSCVILFSGLMPIANMFAVKKLGYSKDSLYRIIWNEIKHSFFLGIFFSGLSFHLLEAIISHAFGLNMSWSTTQKELIKNSRGVELVNTVTYLKRMYIYCFFWLFVIIILAFIPYEPIQNRELGSILPLLLMCVCHISMPILLNPGIVKINFKN